MHFVLFFTYFLHIFSCVFLEIAHFYHSQNDEPIQTQQNEEIENKIEKDRSKRFNYLLKQTEIFTHFMTNTGPKSPTKVKTVGRPKKNKDTTDAAAE